MPIPAIIGLILILTFAAVLGVRRFRAPRPNENPPGEGMTGTHFSAGETNSGGPD